MNLWFEKENLKIDFAIWLHLALKNHWSMVFYFITIELCKKRSSVSDEVIYIYEPKSA